MIARIVERRDRAWIAVLVTALSVVGLGAVVADDLWSRLLRPPAALAFATVIALIALSIIGPWLARPSRGRPVRVRREPGKVSAGEQVILAEDVARVSIAAAPVGTSVAIERHDGRVTFLAVERAADAEAIAVALGDPEAGRGAPRRAIVAASLGLAAVQALLGLASLASLVLYSAALVDALPFASRQHGLVGVVVAPLALLLLVARTCLRGQALSLRRGAWDAHVSLHLAACEGSASWVDEPADASHPLARGDETLEAWLARVDGLPTLEGAYRAGALDKGALWETLEDAGARPDARIAAARLLRRRFHEDPTALVRVASEPELRARIAIASESESDDEAPRRLAALGPLFRAR